MKIQNFCGLRLKKILRTDYFRVTQNLNLYVEFYIQSSQLYMSSEKNVFKNISKDMILKYIGVSVAAKMSLKFGVSTREIPRNSSKFTKNYIFDLFWFP